MLRSANVELSSNADLVLVDEAVVDDNTMVRFHVEGPIEFSASGTAPTEISRQVQELFSDYRFVTKLVESNDATLSRVEAVEMLSEDEEIKKFQQQQSSSSAALVWKVANSVLFVPAFFLVL